MPPITPGLLEFQRRANHQGGPSAKRTPHGDTSHSQTLNVIRQGHLGQEKCLGIAPTKLTSAVPATGKYQRKADKRANTSAGTAT